jgi:hypothetical protein
MCYGFAWLRALHDDFVVVAINLNVGLRVEPQHGFFDSHFAVPASHALHFKCVFHE